MSNSAPRVIDAQLIDGNVTVTFEGGCTVVFPPGLLFASRNIIRRMDVLTLEDDLSESA